MAHSEFKVGDVLAYNGNVLNKINKEEKDSKSKDRFRVIKQNEDGTFNIENFSTKLIEIYSIKVMGLIFEKSKLGGGKSRKSKNNVNRNVI